MVPLTVTRPPARAKRRNVVVWVVVGVLALAVTIPLGTMLGDTARSDVAFVNPTHWAMDVDLVTDAGASRVVLATVPPNQTITVDDIARPDGDWLFVFTAWGESESVLLTEDELEAAGHRVRVPDALVAKLTAAGRPATPLG